MAEAHYRTVGMVGMVDDVDSVTHAAETVRDAGWQRWDCHTPYPVHGLDRAMGMRESPIPWVTLTCGFTGIAVALTMQWFMSVHDYPVRIGGKPLWSWPAFVPVTFELFILFSAISTFLCVLFFCKLLRWHHPLQDTGLMAQVTRDRFAVVLDARDPQYDAERAKELLEKAGCKDIQPLRELIDDGKVH